MTGVFLGLNTHYFVHLDSGEEVEIIQESSIDSIIRPGTHIKLQLNTEKSMCSPPMAPPISSPACATTALHPDRGGRIV